MNDNYFRLRPYVKGPLCGRDVYPFDGGDAESVALAWENVKERARQVRPHDVRLRQRQEIVVWKQPSHDGPWRDLMTVGHEDAPSVLPN